MKHPRSSHGCAFVPSTDKTQAQVIVVGGDEWLGHANERDSTVETFQTNMNEWTSKKSFPLKNYWREFTVVNSKSPEYLVYSIGGRDYKGYPISTIYGLAHFNDWEVVANTVDTHSYHTSLNLQKEDIGGCK